MSGLWLTPAAPGTVAPAYLEQIRELHSVVRGWIEASATAQKNVHLLANLPYVDLMFAFGFATLGDHPTANKLVEDARKVMEGPIPAGGNALADQIVTAAVARNFLFHALRTRIVEVFEGRPHVGPLPPSVSTELDELRVRSRQGPVNNPYKLALFVIDRFREQYSIVEPEEQPDPYFEWTTHGDAIQQGLREVWERHDPVRLVQTTRELFREVESQKNPADARYRILYNVLPRAGRAGEAFVLELVGMVPEVVVWLPPDPKAPLYLPHRQVQLLVRALQVVVRYRRAEPVAALTNTFADVVRNLPTNARLGVWRRGADVYLRSLQDFASREETRQLLAEWRESVFGNLSLEELRNRCAEKREDWLVTLSGLHRLAGGWLWLGERALAEPILSTGRQELLNPDGRRTPAHAYTELARAYIAAVSNDEVIRGIRALTELFRESSPTAITNTWVTAQYYSRFHLELVEDTVFAVCRLGLDNPVPITVTA